MVRSTRKQANNKLSQEGKIGLAGAMAIGIGGMVGGGIFAVLGEAVTLARGATPAAFLVAGVLAFLTSYSYSKLSVRYPSQGGTVVYIDKAFGYDLAALLSLLIYTYKSAPQSLWIFIAFVVLSVLFELIYSLFLKKTLKINQKNKQLAISYC